MAVGLDPPSVGGGTEAGIQPHIRAIGWVRGETFKVESETADLWQPTWNDNQIVLAAAIHTPDSNVGPLEGTATESWSLGIVEQSQGKGCCGLWRDGLRGCEGGDCGGKCLWRKDRQPWKQGSTAESRIGGGAITIATLPPQASIGSWTIESLAHQTPDALNYRVGAHPGCPFKCLSCQTIEKEPREGSPSKCLNERSYRETLAKEAFWLPATRGSKKDSNRAITPEVEVVCVPAHLALSGSPQAKQLYHLHAELSLGQCCHRQKKTCIHVCRVTLVVSNSLQPYRLWPAGFSVREPKQLHHLHIWPSQRQTQVLQGSLRSKPQWTTHMQRWK